MPSLFGLPAHLLRQLSPGWRRVVLGALGLVVAAGIVAAIILAPQISESKRDRAAEERRAQRVALQRERARLVAEQRPRFGRVAAGTGLVAGVERSITRDALARNETGELKTPVQRTDCHSIGHQGERVRLACTAVTHEVERTDSSGAVLIGYPYAAAYSPSTRRYALCKTSGRPGEGSFTHKAPVELPTACGG